MQKATVERAIGVEEVSQCSAREWVWCHATEVVALLNAPLTVWELRTLITLVQASRGKISKRHLCRRFGVKHLKNLPRHAFDEAMRLLVDAYCEKR